MKKTLLVLILVLFSVSAFAVYKNPTEKSPLSLTNQGIRTSVTRVAFVTSEEAVEKEEAVQAAEEIEVPEEEPAAESVEEAVEKEEAVQAAEEIEVPEVEPAAESVEEAVEKEVAVQAAEEIEMPEVEPAAVIEDGREKIVVLPFDNLSKEINAIKKIMPEVRQRLEDRGLHVIDEDVLSDFLCDRRVRDTGYISKKIAQEVGREMKAKTILAGSIVSFSSKGTPKIGILARLIDSSTGMILWADYASVSGDDYFVLFELGIINEIEELVPKALDKLFASFSTDISKKNTESVQRIAVMPFKNMSDFPNAGKIVTYMFLVELLKDPAFEPIEYGEIRRLCVKLRIRKKGELEFKNIKALSETLGTHGILLGSVDDYAYESKTSSVPKVGITARLLDARENRILWYNSLQLSGEEDIIAFDWGSVRQVDKLAYKAVSELVEKIGKLNRY